MTNYQLKLQDPKSGLEDYFSIGWSIFRQHFKQFIILVLILSLPVIIINQFVTPTEDPATLEDMGPLFVLGIIGAILSIVGSMAGAIIAEHAILNRSMDALTALKAGFARFVPGVLISILTGIVVCIGLILLLLPGIYLAVVLGFSLYAVALRGAGLNAWKYSYQLVKGRWWSVFGSLLVIGIAFFLLFVLIVFVFGVITLATALIPPLSASVAIAGDFLLALASYLLTATTVALFLRLDYSRHGA